MVMSQFFLRKTNIHVNTKIELRKKLKKNRGIGLLEIVTISFTGVLFSLSKIRQHMLLAYYVFHICEFFSVTCLTWEAHEEEHIMYHKCDLKQSYILPLPK